MRRQCIDGRKLADVRTLAGELELEEERVVLGRPIGQHDFPVTDFQRTGQAAQELGPSGIRVNAVQPGLVDTELVGFITAGGDLLDDYLQQMPIARVGTVDDIAAAVRYLAGPESSWVTGQMIGVDGGHQLRRGPNYGLIVEEMYGADACRGLIE